MNNDAVLLRQKTDQPFQVDFAFILRYKALLKVSYSYQ
jgi:hypothetical protein